MVEIISEIRIVENHSTAQHSWALSEIFESKGCVLLLFARGDRGREVLAKNLYCIVSWELLILCALET
jgi:hypothetical protein